MPPQSNALPAARYDVGQVVRDYTKAIIGVAPNHATPATWIDVLDQLHRLTLELEKADLTRQVPSSGVIPPDPDQLKVDLRRWRARLDAYMLAAHAAPDEHDRRSVLWTVTAPLLLGWHGGPTGLDPLPDEGYPEGFDVATQHAPDIGTPFSLANQLNVYVAWQKLRFELLVADVKDSIDEVVRTVTEPGGVPWYVWLLGGGLAYLAVRRK